VLKKVGETGNLQTRPPTERHSFGKGDRRIRGKKSSEPRKKTKMFNTSGGRPQQKDYYNSSCATTVQDQRLQEWKNRSKGVTQLVLNRADPQSSFLKEREEGGGPSLIRREKVIAHI